MNRFTTLMVMISFYVFISTLAYEWNLVVNDGVALGVFGEPVKSGSYIMGVFSTLGGLFTFSLPGMPAMFSVLFIALTVGLVYYFVDVIKDLVPLT